MRTRSGVLAAVLPLAAALLASACSSSSAASGQAAAASGGTIAAIGAENEYANVIQQVGGKYVQVTAIMSNPNTDPHTFEASPAVAREISGLAKANGIPVVGVYETMPSPGYDYQSWMTAEVTALSKAVSGKVSTERL